MRTYVDTMESDGERLLKRVPGAITRTEGQAVTHLVPDQLYKVDSSAWRNVARALNDSAEADIYSVQQINISRLLDGLQVMDAQTLAAQLKDELRRLNRGGDRRNTVLYLPEKMIKRLGPELVKDLSAHATLVTYGNTIQGRAVFVHALVTYGDVLRDMMNNAKTKEDLANYERALSALYKIITHGRKFDITMLESLLEDSAAYDPFEFLTAVVAEFPPINEELERWMQEHKEEAISEAIAALAV